MSKTIKIISIILISALLIFNMPIYSNAFDDIISAGKDFLNPDDGGSSVPAGTPTEAELQSLSNMVSNVLLTIALAVTLISAVVMGINFAIQSVEDKAKIKESMVPWIIGIIISFGAYGIWRITMSVFYDLNI